jgi:hypothetical protein
MYDNIEKKQFLSLPFVKGEPFKPIDAQLEAIP